MTKIIQEIRIGTRASPLAMKQVEMAIEWLRQKGVTEALVPVPMTTSGDRIKDKPLYDVGGKALFAKELEEALLEKRIDIAVHSLKDVEVNMPDGLVIGAYLPRGEVGDALVSAQGWSLETIPSGAIVGTVSPRRQVSILQQRPDLVIKPVRGNFGTRLGKLDAGEYDALVMAEAGLKRLHITSHPYVVLSKEEMLPAAGQGVVVIQCCEDSFLFPLLSQMSDLSTKKVVETERALLSKLGGSCRTAVGSYAELKGQQIWLRGMFAPELNALPVYGDAYGASPLEVAQTVADLLLQVQA